MDNPVLVETQTLTNIADGIRIIGNNSNKYLPSEMKTAILAAEESILNRAATTATATGNPVSFTDGAENIPVKALTVAIEPVQDGSGDPSPDNVRPISGWTGCRIAVTDNAPLISIEPIQEGEGDPSPENIRPILPGLSFERDDGSTLDVYGGTLDVTTGVLTVMARSVGLPSVSSISTSGVGTGKVASFALNREYTMEDNSQNSACSHLTISSFINRGVAWQYYFWRGTMQYFVPSDSTIESVNETISGAKVMLRLTTPVTYQLTPQEVERALVALGIIGNVYDISFPTGAGTVYGGTLDVTNGALTVTHGNIASYNGEALPGEWISSMDVYSAGGSPTAGAQVVYTLVSPHTYQLTPKEVRTLLGENHISADTGPVTVTYRAKATGNGS